MALIRPRFSQLNTIVTTIDDPLTVLNKGGTSANIDVGFIINRDGGNTSNLAMIWDQTANNFAFGFTTASGATNANISIGAYANLRAGSFIGDGSQLTGIVSGYGNTNVAAYLTTHTGNVNAGNVVAGTIYGNIGGGSTLSNVYVTGSLIPSANITYDLGSPTQRWRDGWFSGTTIYIGSESMGVDENGKWTFTSGGASVELGSNVAFNPPSANISGNVSASYILGNGVLDSLTVSGNIQFGSDHYVSQQYVLWGTTSNNSETELFIGGVSSTRIPVATNRTVFYEIQIVARRTDATGESGSWHIKGCADNFSDTVGDVGDIYEVIVARDDMTWTVDARADDTTNSVNVYVTGATGKTIRWTAVVKTIEVAQ